MFLVFLLLLVLAGGLRFARIDEPRRIMFDEVHYVPDSREILHRGVEIDRPAHPPFAKVLVGASIAVFGDRPIGWRLVPALSGVVVVAATYVLGRRLFAPPWAAALAAFLVAVDGLALVMSRIAMLDGIQAAFVAIGAVCVVLDHQTGDRRWRWVTGIVLGLGTAIKWTTAPVLAAALLIALVAEVRRSPRSWAATARTFRRVVVPLAVVPVLLYVASYSGWFANYERSETGRERCAPNCTMTDVASGWVFEQRDMWNLQHRLKAKHPDRSWPTAWLTLRKPVLSYATSCLPPNPQDDCEVPTGTRARIVGLGNPVLWWPALPSFVYLAWRTLRRDRRAAFVLAFGAAQVLPWLASWKPGFAYYLTPVVPFVALSLVLALVDLAARWPVARWLPGAVAVGAALALVWFYPVWTGWPLPPSSIERRLWFSFWHP